jgi:DNA-binding transcriptional regulator YiaG
MTPADLKAIRRRLGLTQKGLAQALTNLDCPTSPRTVEGWEQGHPRTPIPRWLPAVIQLMLMASPE